MILLIFYHYGGGGGGGGGGCSPSLLALSKSMRLLSAIALMLTFATLRSYVKRPARIVLGRMSGPSRSPPAVTHSLLLMALAAAIA